jgi:hypothetical protein
VFDTKFAFSFSLCKFNLKLFFLFREELRDIIINESRSSRKRPPIFSTLANLIFPTDFNRVNNMKFHKQPGQWKHSCSIRTDVRTDGRHDEASGRFPQLCERVKYVYFINTKKRLKVMVKVKVNVL